MASNTATAKNGRLWEIMSKIVVWATIALIGIVGGHEVRLAKIEESRFTALDGATLERRMIESLPPKDWLRDKFNSLESTQREILSRLRELESR